MPGRDEKIGALLFEWSVTGVSYGNNSFGKGNSGMVSSNVVMGIIMEDWYVFGA